MAVRTGTGRYFIKPVPKSIISIIEKDAATDISCELPPYCSPIALLDTEPFTGQQPVMDAAIFPRP